jgi:hypothetical protein
MVSANVMNKINKLIDKDQKNQLKEQNKKNNKLLNKSNIIIEI